MTIKATFQIKDLFYTKINIFWNHLLFLFSLMLTHSLEVVGAKAFRPLRFLISRTLFPSIMN